jgi:DNA-nicking Smr family endonuclease
MDKPHRARLTDADHAAWASYASRITPLPGRNRPVLADTPAQAGELPVGSRARAQTPRPRPGAHVRGAHIAAASLMVGTQPGGVDSGSWQRFRTGKLRAARVLDLHGQTAQRAYHALVAFLRTAHADRLRCVEVVTGRGSRGSATGSGHYAGGDPVGGGVLRRELPFWLNLPEIRPLVLAAAHPHAANPGSVRLLLRRAR